jgi:predicted outer membrane lipoprotein
MVELNCSVPVITAMWDELLHMVGDLQEKQHDGAKRVLS